MVFYVSLIHTVLRNLAVGTLNILYLPCKWMLCIDSKHMVLFIVHCEIKGRPTLSTKISTNTPNLRLSFSAQVLLNNNFKNCINYSCMQSQPQFLLLSHCYTFTIRFFFSLVRSYIDLIVQEIPVVYPDTLKSVATSSDQNLTYDILLLACFDIVRVIVLVPFRAQHIVPKIVPPTKWKVSKL